MPQQLKDRNIIFFGAPETLRDVADKVGVRELARLLEVNTARLYYWRTRRGWPSLEMQVRIHDVTCELARTGAIPPGWIVTADDWAQAFRESRDRYA